MYKSKYQKFSSKFEISRHIIVNLLIKLKINMKYYTKSDLTKH